MTLRQVAADTLRLLTFGVGRERLRAFGRAHLAFGLFCAWAVGIGRHWDDPAAGLAQRLGVGSVVYVFALALLLWLVVKPLRPARWSYAHVCTFVALASPPAALYAIPVERYVPPATAASLNVWFLAAVALWRVALLYFYLRRHAALGRAPAAVSTLLPLAAIVSALTALNLQRGVFDLMGGLRGQSADESVYAVLFLLTLLSLLLIVPLLTLYLYLVIAADRRAGAARLLDGPGA